MFGDESMRLLRTKWKSAQDLAEELYAMFNDDIPLTTNAPITIQLPEGSTQPGLIIKNAGDGPMVQFQKPGSDVGAIDNNGDLVGPPLPGQKKPAAKSGGGGTVVASDVDMFAGVVIGGSGSTYTMQLYLDDGTTALMESGIPKIFNVKQMQIDPSATIPVGTWAPVFLRRGKYFMFVPVWLGT